MSERVLERGRKTGSETTGSSGRGLFIWTLRAQGGTGKYATPTEQPLAGNERFGVDGLGQGRTFGTSTPVLVRTLDGILCPVWTLHFQLRSKGELDERGRITQSTGDHRLPQRNVDSTKNKEYCSHSIT